MEYCKFETQKDNLCISTCKHFNTCTRCAYKTKREAFDGAVEIGKRLEALKIKTALQDTLNGIEDTKENEAKLIILQGIISGLEQAYNAKNN